METQRLALANLHAQIEAQCERVNSIASEATKAREEYHRLVSDEVGLPNAGTAGGSAPAAADQSDPATCQGIANQATAKLAPDDAQQLIALLQLFSGCASPPAGTPATLPAAPPAAMLATVPAAGPVMVSVERAVQIQDIL